jgi:hypothetical protein
MAEKQENLYKSAKKHFSPRSLISRLILIIVKPKNMEEFGDNLENSQT